MENKFNFVLNCWDIGGCIGLSWAWNENMRTEKLGMRNVRMRNVRTEKLGMRNVKFEIDPPATVSARLALLRSLR